MFDGGRVLLIKRGAQPAQGLWSIPGGKVIRGESLAAAVERELKEETGLEVRAGDLVAVYERRPDPNAGDDDPHYVVLDYLCRSVGGRLAVGDDAADAGWFQMDELTGLNLTLGAAAVIAKGWEMAGREGH